MSCSFARLHQCEDAERLTSVMPLMILRDRDKFQNLADGPNKTALAIQLLGRQGQQLIPVLNVPDQRSAR